MAFRQAGVAEFICLAQCSVEHEKSQVQAYNRNVAIAYAIRNLN